MIRFTERIQNENFNLSRKKFKLKAEKYKYEKLPRRFSAGENLPWKLLRFYKTVGAERSGRQVT